MSTTRHTLELAISSQLQQIHNLAQQIGYKPNLLAMLNQLWQGTCELDGWSAKYLDKLGRDCQHQRQGISDTRTPWARRENRTSETDQMGRLAMFVVPSTSEREVAE